MVMEERGRGKGGVRGGVKDPFRQRRSDGVARLQVAGASLLSGSTAFG